MWLRTWLDIYTSSIVWVNQGDAGVQGEGEREGGYLMRVHGAPPVEEKSMVLDR